MVIVWADVLAIAPELSTVSLAAQALVLAHVNAELDVSMFDGEDGPTTRLARIFLAAHLGTSVGKGSKAGEVVSESAGGLSRSYSQLTTSDAAMGLTAYGRHYLSLAQNSFARLPVVI